MNSKLKRLLKGEGGITGLETAIILIAFVVVAAVFAFTVLSAGVFSSEKGKEAVYAGLGEVRGSMEIRGSVRAESTDTGDTGQVDNLKFTVSNVAGGAAIDFSDHGSANQKVVIDYRDKDTHAENLEWTKTARGMDDGDDLLEEGEQYELTVPISATSGISLTINELFAIEIKPERGGVLVIERTTPSYIDKVMSLD